MIRNVRCSLSLSHTQANTLPLSFNRIKNIYISIFNQETGKILPPPASEDNLNYITSSS